MRLVFVFRRLSRLLSLVVLVGWLGASVKGESKATETFQEFTERCVKQALQPFDEDCKYPPISQTQALLDIRDKWIVFYGESTLRYLFLQFLGAIESKEWDRIPDQKSEKIIERRLSGSRFTFTYTPYYDNLTDVINDPPVLNDGRKPDLIVLNDGLHDLLYQPTIKMNQAWQKMIQAMIDIEKKGKFSTPVIWVTPSFIHDKYLTLHRKKSPRFKNATLAQIMDHQSKVMDGMPHILTYNVYRSVGDNDPDAIPIKDGVHNMRRARYEAEGFIGALHWINEDPTKWGYHPVTVGQIMCLISYLIVTFIFVIGEISIRFCYKKVPVASMDDLDAEEVNLLASDDEKEPIQMQVRSVKFNGDGSVNKGNDVSVMSPSKLPKVTVTVKNSDKSSDIQMEETEMQEVLSLPDGFDRFAKMIESYKNDKQVYRAMFSFGVCIILVYLSDGPNHMFSPYLKEYNRDWFIFIHIVILVISGLTMKKEVRTNNVLCGRRFTEEWKGIMQIMFVLYHYYDAAEVYNAIRVFIASYVWMTGFGNTCYFLRKKSFSAVRLFGMLFRLNWLVFWVCLILNEDLMLYYICPLHTFFFLMVYVTWGIGNQFNHIFSADPNSSSSSSSSQYNYRVIGIKLLLCLVFLIVMFEIPGVFYAIWQPIASIFPFIFKYHGTIYEWKFRTTLDHYAAWFGMLFGVFYSECNTVLQSIESIKNKENLRATKIAIGIVVSVILYLWFSYVYCHDKYTYNEMHPYTSIIPIMSYLVLRNLIFDARQYFSKFLIWMGQTTLETYIFQYHLYMIDDAKSILTVIHNYPLVNFLLTSVVYVWLSRVAFESTDLLRNYLFPESAGPDHPLRDNVKMIVTTAKYCSVIGAISLFSWGVHSALF